MEAETPLAQEIQSAEQRIKYDATCKCLLSNKIILAWILTECVQEYRNISPQDIASKYIVGTPAVSAVPVGPDTTRIPGTGVEDTSITEGTVVYDIRFDARVPSGDGCIYLIINVEAQYDTNPGYPLIKRGIY